MKIRDIKVLRGPNYWSISRHKFIVMVLDLEEMENCPTNKVKRFSERLEKLLPSLFHHQCSENHEGGFFYRVKKGTWMGHVMEHIALEIQTLAGMDCGFGRTRTTGEKGVYNVVFSYIEEEVGLFAAHAAFKIVLALINNEDYNLEADLQTMKKIREEVALGSSTKSIIEEAEKRGIPWKKFNRDTFVTLGYGINQKRMKSTMSSTTSCMGVDITTDKGETKTLLEEASIPVPKGATVFNEEELGEAVKNLDFPLVIKPLNGNHGRGITINIKSWEDALKAFNAAKEISEYVIAEKHIAGSDFRLLLINYKLVAAAKRTPAAVTGNGTSTIQELIDTVNKDPKRGDGHLNVLTKIKVDDMTLNILKEKNLSLESILPQKEIVYLKGTANLSTGGTATDVTDMVHPYTLAMAERIARLVDLDVCGIDIIAPNIDAPLDENGGVVIEVNASPGFRMHIAPSEGIPRNVTEPFMDMLYPNGSSATIPIVAITGTNGKTTTTRLVAHIAKCGGYKVGFTTTEGIYIKDRMLRKGDCTGPKSAAFILKDPTVDFAVLESARGGILREGLAFTSCDVAIVTNIGDDHLGLEGINTLEQLATVKAVVPETVSRDGYAILNADDDLVYEMAKGLDCNIAYFSMDSDNPRIIRHCNKGGIAAVVENEYITILKGKKKIRIDKVANIPLTFSGKATFMTQNILPAVLTGYVRNFRLEDIQNALKTFIPSPAQTPGRMNLFQFDNFDVLIDFAHNPHGYAALGKYLEAITGKLKVGIIVAIGDRRDEDIINVGRICSGMFDEIIIKQDENLRGRTEQEIVDLITKGINETNPKPVKIIHKENDAVTYAIKHAKKDSLITICTDKIMKVIELVGELKEEAKLEMNNENDSLKTANPATDNAPVTEVHDVIDAV